MDGPPGNQKKTSRMSPEGFSFKVERFPIAPW
jgi:hypothetical protein